MIWLYERGDEVVRLETRVDFATKEYVITIDWADRAPETERYLAIADFKSRIAALEKQLASDHWSHSGDSPTLLPNAWRGPFTH